MRASRSAAPRSLSFALRSDPMAPCRSATADILSLTLLNLRGRRRDWLFAAFLGYRFPRRKTCPRTGVPYHSFGLHYPRIGLVFATETRYGLRASVRSAHLDIETTVRPRDHAIRAVYHPDDIACILLDDITDPMVSTRTIPRIGGLATMPAEIIAPFGPIASVQSPGGRIPCAAARGCPTTPRRLTHRQ
jgi:hypothetical protein